MAIAQVRNQPAHQLRKEALGRKVNELWYPRPTKWGVANRDKEIMERICQLYQAGYTLRELGDWFLTTHESIRTTLQCSHIPRRNKGHRKQEKPIGQERVRGEYIMIHVGSDFPGAPKNGWMPKHRLVMQLHLNRTLLPWEVVHHKDRNKLNNDISNLKVLPSQEHPTCRGCPYYKYFVDKTGEKYLTT